MNEFAEARQVIIEAFKDRSEGEIRHVYFCNISMLLQDRFDVEAGIADIHADAILDLCFKE